MMHTDADHTYSKEPVAKQCDASEITGVVPFNVNQIMDYTSEIVTPNRAWDEVPWSPTDLRQNPDSSLGEMDTPKVGDRAFKPVKTNA